MPELTPSSLDSRNDCPCVLPSFIASFWEKDLSHLQNLKLWGTASHPAPKGRAQDAGPDPQSWPCPQVEQQLIRYVHDGSETQTDSFILVANASEMDRQSQPVALVITILPVNDQPPILTTNTGLQVRACEDSPHLPSWRGPAHSFPLSEPHIPPQVK